MHIASRIAVLALALVGATILVDLRADDAAHPKTTAQPRGWGFASSGAWKTQALEPNAKKAIDWIVAVQGVDGGWGQDGGGTAHDAQGGRPMSAGNDVSNTALAALALMRAGSTPASGPYAENLQKAVRFVLAQVEDAPTEGIEITRKTGTQVQYKLGPHIDTFLGALVLAEVDGRMPDEAGQARVRAALTKCVTKIEKNQQADGSWNAGGGWAPVVGTGIASRALFNARAKGVTVTPDVLDKVAKYAHASYNSANGQFDASLGGAGVELYQAAQALETTSRSGDTRADTRAENPVLNAITRKIADPKFLAGLGSMGGEEFVSYLTISDSLMRFGGDSWKKWNAFIKERLGALQNADGTFAGHHCITGRVACTSAAVLTMIAERTATPGAGSSAQWVVPTPDEEGGE